MPEEPLPEVPKERGDAVPPTESTSAPETTPVFPEKNLEQKGEHVEGKYLEILQKTSPAASPAVAKDDETAATAKTIGALADEETKVSRLLELAEQKGVAQAVKIAYALKDYYILDRMHDELADKLYTGLLEKGLVTRE